MRRNCPTCKRHRCTCPEKKTANPRFTLRVTGVYAARNSVLYVTEDDAGNARMTTRSEEAAARSLEEVIADVALLSPISNYDDAEFHIKRVRP